jgi:membrane-bound serine protease (ClpP class)
MLFESPSPFMKLSLWVMMPTVILMTSVILGAMYYAVSLHRRRPVSGAEGLISEVGTALEDIDAGSTGKVFVEGEYWDAVADGTIRKGEEVKVVEIKGLTLKVTRA